MARQTPAALTVAMPQDFDPDKPRLLRFDLSAIQDMETQMGGKPLGAIVEHLAQMGINALCIAIWAGLKHEDRTLTPRLVTKMVERYIQSGKALKRLLGPVNDAIEKSGLFRSMEEESDEDDEGNDQPEPRIA